MFKKKKKIVATNEFNQQIEGTSLTKEAWKRLKKNKMAVSGMVIVIIYAIFAAFAGFLPLYPYEESILDHQHLAPSLTKTSGELMMESKLKDLAFKAWKSGALSVSEEDNEQIKSWIKANKTNKVWDLCLEEALDQIEDGTFAWSNSDQKTIDRTQKKIDTDIQVTIQKVYFTNEEGKRINLASAPSATLAPIYANWLGVDKDAVFASLDKEIKAGLTNEVKAKMTESTPEETESEVNLELENMSAKEKERRMSENLYGKLEAQTKRGVEKSLKAEIEEGKTSFPVKGMRSLDHGISAKIQANMKHARRYFLGTDYLGRDMLSRIIYGGRVSIAIGLIGTITSVIIGILVGALAGYKGGKVDYYLMRFVDIMYGLPYMLLVIICMAIFGRQIFNLFFALAMVSWLTIARMVRGQIMSLKNQEYVEAARSMGANTWHIILRHMIPNSLSIIIVYSTIRIPAFIMQESFLSFLGLGVQAPYASWGSLIGDAVASMTLYPWKLLGPSFTMVLFLFAMNFFGDGLRDAFDPQSKNQL